jgi:23S rRNA pseudouridine1911/1915/1917 synthase
MSPSSDKLFFPVTSAVRGQRLDQVVCARAEGWSRTRVQALIKAGCVRLSGKIVRKPGLILMDEGEIEVELALPVSERDRSVAAELAIVFSDEHLIVIDKPAGLLTHGNAPGERASVADLARDRFGALPSMGGPERAGLVHRLDRETSGLLVLARTEEALADLKRQFHERTVAKTYLAIVHGDPRFDSDWIEAPLGRRESSRDRISIMKAGEGRAAVTYFEVRERFVRGGSVDSSDADADRDASGSGATSIDPEACALLAVFPKTGRTHQVRVHLASIKLPLVGETLYMPRRRALPRLPAGAPPIGRQALHAHVLEFEHPITREALRFESPLPDDMSRLLAWLRARVAA